MTAVAMPTSANAPRVEPSRRLGRAVVSAAVNIAGWTRAAVSTEKDSALWWKRWRGQNSRLWSRRWLQ